MIKGGRKKGIKASPRRRAEESSEASSPTKGPEDLLGRAVT